MPKPTLEDGFRRPQHSLPFMVELPTNAYATPNSPKCKDAYSHLWNTLTSDAAFLLSRFIPSPSSFNNASHRADPIFSPFQTHHVLIYTQARAPSPQNLPLLLTIHQNPSIHLRNFNHSSPSPKPSRSPRALRLIKNLHLHTHHHRPKLSPIEASSHHRPYSPIII
ncbi:hypothetical protein V6N12_029961 [Hibiscus sabdariffa]|uniref:Uncharacterized protein n=1 Tax=Hibiscus sabdariffa TaxID=183260 RepID=A0ABR2B0I7_9ROSI